MSHTSFTFNMVPMSRRADNAVCLSCSSTKALPAPSSSPRLDTPPSCLGTHSVSLNAIITHAMLTTPRPIVTKYVLFHDSSPPTNPLPLPGVAFDAIPVARSGPTSCASAYMA